MERGTTRGKKGQITMEPAPLESKDAAAISSVESSAIPAQDGSKEIPVTTLPPEAPTLNLPIEKADAKVSGNEDSSIKANSEIMLE